MSKLDAVERRILGEVYSSSEAMENLTVLCDDHGGRFAGTPENRAAAEFLLGKFEEYGFEDPHLESFRFKGCEVGSSKLEILEPIEKEVSCLTLPMTVSGEAEADLVFIDGETKMDTGELEGKVVMGLTRPPFIRGSETDVSGFIWIHPYPAMGPPRAVSTARSPRSP